MRNPDVFRGGKLRHYRIPVRCWQHHGDTSGALEIQQPNWSCWV